MILTYLPCVQYLHSAWFLDGRTSIFVFYFLKEQLTLKPAFSYENIHFYKIMHSFKVSAGYYPIYTHVLYKLAYAKTFTLLYRSRVIQSYRTDMPIFLETFSCRFWSATLNNYVIKCILPDAESCEQHDAI